MIKGSAETTSTDGADTFVGTVDAATAANNTLTAADNINGGAGNDTLKITAQGATAVTDATNGAAISSIETVEIRAVLDAAATVTTMSGASVPGVTLINSNLSTSAVTLTNIADATAIQITGNGVATNGATTATYVAAATSGELTIAGGVTAGAIAVNGAGLTSLSITSSGAANTTGAISTTGTPTAVTINAATALTTTGLTVGTNAAAQTLTISGAGKVTLGTLDDNFATVTASANTGGVVATLNGLVTGTTTGSAGNDTFTTAAVLTTGSVNAGAGTDTLVVADSTHLASATLGAKYTNFETLQVNNAVSVDLDNISGITAIRINDGAGATAVTDLTAVQASAITMIAANGATTIGVKNATTAGQIDTVKITYDNGNTTLNEAFGGASNLTLAGVESLEITAVDQASIVQSAATSGSLTSVKLFGAGNHSFTTGDIATSNFTLDASGSTGTNTLSAATFATNGVSITGGSGADTITGSGQADVIVGGAGIDTINATAGADAITLGAGNDIVVYTLTAAVTLGNLSNIATLDTISDFVTGSDKLHFDDAAVTALAKASSAQLTAIQNAVDGLAAGSTLTQAVAAAATALNVDNSAVTAGSIYSFTFGGNTFVAVDSTIANGTASATDTLLVQLTGITSVDLTNDITII